MGVVASQSGDGGPTVTATAPFKNVNICAADRDVIAVNAAIEAANFYPDVAACKELTSTIVQVALRDFKRFQETITSLLEEQWVKTTNGPSSVPCCSRDKLVAILALTMEKINAAAFQVVEDVLQAVTVAECDLFSQPAAHASQARPKLATMKNKVQLAAQMHLEKALTVLRKALLHYADVLRMDFQPIAVAVLQPLVPDFTVAQARSEEGVSDLPPVDPCLAAMDTAVTFERFAHHIVDIVLALVDLPKLVEEIALVQRTAAFRSPYAPNGERIDGGGNLLLQQMAPTPIRTVGEAAAAVAAASNGGRHLDHDNTQQSTDGCVVDAATQRAPAESLRARLHALQMRNRITTQAASESAGGRQVPPTERGVVTRRIEETAPPYGAHLVGETPSHVAALLRSRTLQLASLIAEVHRLACVPPSFATYSTASGSHILELDAAGGQHRFRMTRRDVGNEGMGCNPDGTPPATVLSGAYCQLSAQVMLLLVSERVTAAGMREHYVDTIQLVREEISGGPSDASAASPEASQNSSLGPDRSVAFVGGLKHGWRDVTMDVFYNTLIPPRSEQQ